MKKLYFFPVITFLLLGANGLLAQENPSGLEIEKLTRQKEYLRTRIYEIVRDNKLLEEKIKLFEGKANAYDEVVAKDQKTISELKVACDQLEHDMKTLQEENNSLLNSLEDKENFIQNIQENVEKEMLAQKQQLLAEFEHKNQDFNAVQNQLKESQDNLSTIQAQHNLAQETSADIQEKKEAMDEKNKSYMSRILELEESNKQTTGSYEEQNKQITFKNDALTHTVDELLQKNKILEKQGLKVNKMPI